MANIKFPCPHCAQPIEAPFDMLGQLMDCPACGQTVEVQKSPTKLPPPPPAAPRPPPKLKMPMPHPAPAPKKASGVKEYKVLTQRDKFFAGEFSLEKLEPAINAYAAQGWRVVSVTTLGVPASPGGDREELIVILGRDK